MSTVGYASAPVERHSRGLLSRFGGREAPVADDGESTNRVVSLVRRAALGRLTLPCELQGTERALVVVSGPPEAISRRGAERARAWLEEAAGTMEVRGGDAPVDSDYVAAVVLLSGVVDVPRIRELQAVAVEAQRDVAERDAAARAGLEDLLGGDDAVEPLF